MTRSAPKVYTVFSHALRCSLSVDFGLAEFGVSMLLVQDAQLMFIAFLVLLHNRFYAFVKVSVHISVVGDPYVIHYSFVLRNSSASTLDVVLEGGSSNTYTLVGEYISQYVNLFMSYSHTHK
jgi:hypothetical protein